MFNQILIIQTASLGDVILSTALAESLHTRFPGAKIDYLVKKGYEDLFDGHPFIRKVFVWNKKDHKYRNLWYLCLDVRKTHYDVVINVQRFFTSGLITLISGAPVRSGFDKNPLSFGFNRKASHKIGETGNNEHETERNHHLIDWIEDINITKPALYPSDEDFAKVKPWSTSRYITISPASLWFTKQFPAHKWIAFINNIPADIRVILLGAKDDAETCNVIIEKSDHKLTENLAGKLGFLQSVALMKDALMNYVNDSAPMHFASAVNAPVTAVYCSTVPAFGFGPLSDSAAVIEAIPVPECRPCGLHGHRQCPEGHFNCAEHITNKQLLSRIEE